MRPATNLQYDPTSAGSYSTSDEGCVGDSCRDIFAISPAPYPVPGYLRMYDDLRKALQISVDDCALQQGVCWVIARDKTLPRCGQRGDPGECNVRGPYSPGMAGLGAWNWRQPWQNAYPDPVRRSVESGWRAIAKVEPEGVSTLQEGCTLPLWQRVFYVGGLNNHFTMNATSMTYRAAVQAAMNLSSSQGKPRVVFGRDPKSQRVVPVVYVHPGGIVTSARKRRGLETQVSALDNFEMQQALAVSYGASLLPHGM